MQNLYRPLAFTAALFFSLFLTVYGQIIPVGSGSYTTTFPGTDAAGRNAFPSGTPQLSGKALGKPVPTNDWWSKLIKENHASNLFNYPFTLRTINQGLVVSYIPWGVISDLMPVTVGVTGMATTKTTVSDYSDWTVTMDWDDGTRRFDATVGIAMPFIYFNKKSSDIAQVTVSSGTVTIEDEMLIIVNAIHGADFAVYAPLGSTWEKNGNTYTSTLNGKDYWSLAFIPLTATDVAAVAREYKRYAYVFPTNTTTTWSYDENSSVLRTDFEITTDVKEGTETEMLTGLLPHQWANLSTDSPQPDKYSYASIRGEIKTMAGNQFSVENTFHGILPTLPYLNNYSEGFSPALLNEKITAIQDNQLDLWTDSYNEGQLMNRLIQTARIAHETGNTQARDKIIATIKDRLENWLTATAGEKAFLFYYNQTWSALIGYPAGHGQDNNINDHHFHWGYFIHAASFLEQFSPGWAAQWGDMVNMLVRDAASTDRDDPMFPYLRNYSPYAGHSWANGFATFPQGNDQESTSESMQFNSSLIHWGTITGNKEIRDLGIYLYTSEQTAIEEYWFDMYERNFLPSQQYALVSRVWGNSYDNGTFWTNDIAASYGIELYPIHGGSLYLAHNIEYVTRLWDEIKKNTGIMNNEANDNLWHDVMWKYLAFIDPPKAIELYNSYPRRSFKFGISDAQTYHWLHAMNALGRVDATITADYPIAAAFTSGDKTIYVAHNYSSEPITVAFSTGYLLEVPAGMMRTSEDIEISGVLSTPFNRAHTGGNVVLTFEATDGTPDKVEFVNGSEVLGTVTEAPYTLTTGSLVPGKHYFIARIYKGQQFNVSNIVEVVVGNQLPFNGTPWEIPGTIEAGKYDIFEGGKGQNITYLDLSPGNNGDFRMDEDVDAGYTVAEGATVGWTAAGEWLEYTIEVSQSGNYSFAFRYASGNTAGGGPFSLQLNGEPITSAITVTTTTGWDKWATRTITDIPLTEGAHKLRVVFGGGEFNLGKMIFTRTGDISFSYPQASAGANIKVTPPATQAILDGSGSSESAGKPLTYLWSQVYGPTVIEFSSPTVVNPTVSGLVEGIYKISLKVTNPDQKSSFDEMLIIVSDLDNLPPVVTVNSPASGTSFKENTPVTLSALASDMDGTIEKVEFFANGTLIGTATTSPYTIQWSTPAGNYTITAKAWDNQGATATSAPVIVEFTPLQACTGTSTQASQGSFTLGYNYGFETIGTDVVIYFELLDDKAGVVAYLWNKTPFSERSMLHAGGRKFTITLSGQQPGTMLEVACKFAFAGGMSVTKYFTYKVGDHCGTVNTDELLFMEELAVYPNPATDLVNIRFAHIPAEPVRVEIMNLNGRTVKQQWVNDQLSQVDITGLRPGVYFIRLSNNHQRMVKKVVVK